MAVAVYKNIVSDEDINYLLNFMNKEDSYSQKDTYIKKTRFNSSKDDWPKYWINNLLAKLHITSHPYSIMMVDLGHQLEIHTDTAQGERCDKNIIVPLEVQEDTYTVIFKNKWFGNSFNLDLNNKKLVSGLTDKKFNRELYNKYLSNFDYELIDGLEIHHVYKWEVGSVCVFDSQHLHTNSSLTNNKKAFYIWTIN